MSWLIGLAIFASVRLAAAQETPQWPDEEELIIQLAQSVSLTWSKSPLRGSIQRFGRSQRIGVFLDRRIDPDQRVELSLVDEPLAQAIQRMADSGRLGVSRLGTTFYFGPRETTDLLATIAALRRDEVQRLPARSRGSLSRVRSWQWSDATTPQELLGELANEARIQWQGMERIPHDLWPLADIPPLPWADRLTIVLAGFGMTFRVNPNGSSVEIMPWPAAETVAYQKRYPVGQAAKRLVDQLGGQFETTRLVASGGDLVVTGRYEDHVHIVGLLPGGRKSTKTTKVTTTEQRYTLAVKDVPLRALLNHLSDKLKLQIELDETAARTAGVSLDQPVSVTVEKVTLDELLRKALDGTKLSHNIKGTTVTIHPMRE